jgi:hypothetical protein
MKKYNKERLFEVMQIIDKTFIPKLNKNNLKLNEYTEGSTAIKKYDFPFAKFYKTPKGFLFKSEQEKNDAEQAFLNANDTSFRNLNNEILTTDNWYVDPQEWKNNAKGNDWFVFIK